MRQIYPMNDNWAFQKNHNEVPKNFPDQWEMINIPHTWNGKDGQDGGNDYFRGTCCYVKQLQKEDLPKGQKYYLEINGANSSADVYVNGKHLAHHDGGYATWRVDITQALEEDNTIAILVDNAPNEIVYPQTADFTFYGGLYRSVNLISVPETHFDLDYYGTPGIQVTPVMEGKDAKVEVKTYATG